jgi:uncharacterized protein
MCAAESSRFMCVSVHDVAPATWHACTRLLAMLDGIPALPLTFLVVPNYHGRGRIEAHSQFRRALDKRLARGDEIALHGYYHLDDSPPPRTAQDWIARRVLTQSEGEFAALSADGARARLEWGMTLMRHLDWPVQGFIAPAWLLSEGARTALSDFSFTYTTVRSGVYHLPDWRFTRSPSLVYSVRSPWRRTLSQAFNRRQLGAQDDAPLLRLSLHPVDAMYDEVLNQWRWLIVRALESRTPLTKAAWTALAAPLPEEHAVALHA